MGTHTQDGRTYAVSVTRDGTWQGYLASDGAITRVKVRALQFTHAEAQEAVAHLGADNPEFAFAIKRAFGGKERAA